MNISFIKPGRARRAAALAGGCILVLAALGDPGAAHAQPAIELPADAAQRPVTALPRETAVENALGRGGVLQGSAFGGYGELTLNAPGKYVLDSPPEATIDLRRFVLFFGHNFSERLRFYSEVEIEHAISSAGDRGEAEVEQAYLDGLLSRRISLRGGLMVVPVGIINVYHEPPTFNGVDRPAVDTYVIPTTWREPGVGIFGELLEGVRYQLYLLNGLNANGFTAETAIREGHQEAQLAHAGDWGGVARLDLEPRLGTIIGGSAYHATSGNSLTGTVGSVPVTLYEADARTRIGGFTARAEVAFLFIGNARELDLYYARLSAGGPRPDPVASQARGGYFEAGYDVLRLLAPGSEQSLTLFGRFDYADTQAVVPPDYVANPAFRRTIYTLGLTYRPVMQIGLKLDYRRHMFGDGTSGNELAAAITWMF
jgi:hypothetical protein